jgi:hypothetical protein
MYIYFASKYCVRAIAAVNSEVVWDFFILLLYSISAIFFLILTGVHIPVSPVLIEY